MANLVNPNFIQFDTWQPLFSLLICLWTYVGLEIVFAFALLLAHAIIPSLVETGHLPANTNRIRPFLYGGFFLFLLFAFGTIFTVFWSNNALIQVIYENIYNRRWI
jgi:hypothetical protein